MKKIIISLLTIVLLVGCSSSNTKKSLVQIDSIKWVLPIPEEIYDEAEVEKQKNLFELVPGPQRFYVITHKEPGQTRYEIQMDLKVRLKHRVNIDIDKILSGDVALAKSVANLQFLLLDRNGERIPASLGFGPTVLFLIMFNDYDWNTEWFVEYLTFLQSEPGTEFELFGWFTYCEPDDYCKISFSNLTKEIKGVELRLSGSDKEFEKYIGIIDDENNESKTGSNESYQESPSTDFSDSLCTSNLTRLYNDYVFGKRTDQFGQVVDDLFTMKGKQKLLDAYDYDCETGDCYGIWALRTMAQDGDGESKIIDIIPIGNSKYTIKYLDMGTVGETMVTFAEENGKMKIDDFQTVFDESYDDNVGYMNKENLPRVYSNSNDGFVNIRQTPQSKAPILGVLRNGPEGAALLGHEGEWVKIDCNGIVGYVYEEYIQDTPTEVFEYWGALRKDASSYRFTENDLSPLTAKELTYLRNSVYAKHGYVFNSQELNNYFKQISWYHPDANVTDAVLNSIEKANVEFILNYQKQNGKTYNPQ